MSSFRTFDSAGKPLSGNEMVGPGRPYTIHQNNGGLPVVRPTEQRGSMTKIVGMQEAIDVLSVKTRELLESVLASGGRMTAAVAMANVQKDINFTELPGTN